MTQGAGAAALITNAPAAVVPVTPTNTLFIAAQGTNLVFSWLNDGKSKELLSAPMPNASAWASFCITNATTNGSMLNLTIPKPGAAQTFYRLRDAVRSKVTLTWDPSPDPNVTGYRLYYGIAARNYTNIIDNGSMTAITVSNMNPCTTFYFAATAYDGIGMESDYSDEISYTTP